MYCLVCNKQFKTVKGLVYHTTIKHQTTLNTDTIPWGMLSRHTKRTILFKEANYKCSSCYYDKCRDDGKSILEIDHIDGNTNNNDKCNLRVLCPNCHALTPTYKNWNRTKTKSSNRIRKGNKEFKTFSELNRRKKELFESKFIDCVIKTHSNNEILYSEFGWAKALADMLNIEHSNTVRRLMKKLLPDFYVKHCTGIKKKRTK